MPAQIFYDDEEWALHLREVREKEIKRVLLNVLKETFPHDWKKLVKGTSLEQEEVGKK